MLRIRMHGRGGQGTKTAARILGSALFAEGFEVQDAPRYGAERRGAPIFATVRAGNAPIHERGVIHHPDLVVVVDETLVPVAAAGVLEGIDEHTVLLLRSGTPAGTWKKRLGLSGLTLTLPEMSDSAELRCVGAACAGAAARLLPGVSRAALEGAVRIELASMSESVLGRNLTVSLGAYDAMGEHEGCVSEGPDPSPGDSRPDWIELAAEDVSVSAPDVHAAMTSVQVRTGLWRTMRPVIDHDHCNRCHWVCGSFCPDGAISLDPDGDVSIDYDHCKGCMICVAVCPPHAIRAIPESRACENDEAVR
jgi:pyruvate ferredoxin oxidoreductase gamma subunit